ncbi:SF4 helicase domain-containing protein [Aphelenchoides besseyi]|nr:SF4 helicase domain-containing protein [Aphelenchoides besseyi]
MSARTNDRSPEPTAKKTVAFVVDYGYDSPPPSTSSRTLTAIPKAEKRATRMPPLRTALKPEMVDELDRVALTGIDELDTDLFDNISYLDLMVKKQDRDERRKQEHLANLRRLRENAEKLSARGSDAGAVGAEAPSSDNSANNSDEPNENPSDPDGADNSNPNPMPPTQQPPIDPQIRHIWGESIDLGDVRNADDQAEFRSLLVQLGIDQITSSTLSRYHVRGHMDNYDHAALCYPRYRGPATRGRIPNGLKIIRSLGDKLEKENLPDEDNKNQKFNGIFGLHMITPADNRVVLTTNERDALAVYDSTNGIPALSLPNGEKLDQTVFPYLEDFDLIYLWFPLIHEKHAKDYASYLNSARCYIITKPERPVELLRDDRANEILKGILEAVRVRYRGFRSLVDIRDEVKNELVQNNSKMSGYAQWKRLDVLNRYLKGFRPGELTVLTGGTGYGKTTFLCEYSMDLFSQGEMPDEKILKWMLVQFAAPTAIKSLARSRSFHNGLKLPLHRIDHHPSVEAWLDKFERSHGEMIVMKTSEFRNKTVGQIADDIQAQVIAAGIQHVVIDNLQFLVGMATLQNENSTAQDKYNTQDRFIGRLRRMANDLGVHITVVVHTRKIPDGEDLELQHIGGSARITQEADNVLAIQRRRDSNDRGRERKHLYILKNRYGGRRVETDKLELIFATATYTYTLVDHSHSMK